jgi:hypothetical protein
MSLYVFSCLPRFVFSRVTIGVSHPGPGAHLNSGVAQAKLKELHLGQLSTISDLVFDLVAGNASSATGLFFE